MGARCGSQHQNKQEILAPVMQSVLRTAEHGSQLHNGLALHSSKSNPQYGRSYKEPGTEVIREEGLVFVDSNTVRT